MLILLLMALFNQNGTLGAQFSRNIDFGCAVVLRFTVESGNVSDVTQYVPLCVTVVKQVAVMRKYDIALQPIRIQ